MDDAEKEAKEPKGLVVFDVEGVLIPKRRYIPFETTRKLGILKFLRIAFIGVLYEICLLPLETALRRIFRCFKGYSIEELRGYYERLPLLQGSIEVFQHLRKTGWKTGLISSGLPDTFIKELANKLEADYGIGLKLEVANGEFTGKIQGDVIKRKGKAIVLKEILNQEHLSTKDCVVVADDRNNLPMFPYAGLRIGYNPDFKVAAKSDHVVTGKLSDVLPMITEPRFKKSRPALSRNEIFRSAIHIGGFAVPFICTCLISPYLVSFLIFLVTLFYTISELARMAGASFPVFSSITTRATVKLELHEFTAAPIFYSLGIILALMIFPPHARYASIAILTLGDGFASLLGRKFGKTPYPFNKAKNLEGSLLGFISASLGAIIFTNPSNALVGAAIGMLVESLPLPISDNLTIPIVTGAAISTISI